LKLNVLQEIVRIKNEHPDDSHCIVNDRVKGRLKVTRAFGAGFLKQVLCLLIFKYFLVPIFHSCLLFTVRYEKNSDFDIHYYVTGALIVIFRHCIIYLRRIWSL